MKKSLLMLVLLLAFPLALIVEAPESQAYTASSLNVGTTQIQLLAANKYRQLVSFTNTDAKESYYEWFKQSVKDKGFGSTIIWGW